MQTLLDHPRFAASYQGLAAVRLNPRRHTAPHALAHSEAVAAHAQALARANRRDDAEVARLGDLGRAHDLGKLTGSARPERSLELLRELGVDDPALLALVKWHDTNLPWFQASERGQAPSERAWRRLSQEVDLGALALFMVADRVDAPGGWRRNAPLRWFLDEARRRGLLPPLALDLPAVPSEICAGGALVRPSPRGAELLLVRVRADGWELPKGGLEWDELPVEAAARETREEAGVRGALQAGRELGQLEHEVPGPQASYRKRVRYFLLEPAPGAGDDLTGPCPPRTRERRWVTRDELARTPLVADALRPVAEAALALSGATDAAAPDHARAATG